jgi:hypothetical protein
MQRNIKVGVSARAKRGRKHRKSVVVHTTTRGASYLCISSFQALILQSLCDCKISALSPFLRVARATPAPLAKGSASSKTHSIKIAMSQPSLKVSFEFNLQA